MADTSNLSQFLTDVASAIKTKKGTTDKIPAANFDTEIASIETGIDTSDATANANDLALNKTAYVNEEKIIGTIPELTPYTGVLTMNQNGIGSDGDGTIGYLNSSIDKDTIVRKGTNVSIMADNDSIADMIGLTADKIVKGNSFLGINGTAETGTPINNQDKTITANGTYQADEGYTGLGTVTVNVPQTGDVPVKLFETKETMQSDPDAKEGDLAIVYRSEVQNATVDSKFQVATFPETVVLDTAITDYVDVRYRAVDSSVMFDCFGNLDSSMFMMNCFTESEQIRIQYTSSDGITYTRTDSTGNPVDFGTEIYYENVDRWNDAIGKFIQVGRSTFEGLYEYGNTTYKDKIKFSPLSAISFDYDGSTVSNIAYSGETVGDIYSLESIMNIYSKIKNEVVPGNDTMEFFLNSQYELCVAVPIKSMVRYFYFTSELQPLGFGESNNRLEGMRIYKIDLENETYTLLESVNGGGANSKCYNPYSDILTIPMLISGTTSSPTIPYYLYISSGQETSTKMVDVNNVIGTYPYYNTTEYHIAPTQLTATPEYVYGKEFYGQNSVETGTLQNKENLTKDEVKHRIDIWSNYNSGIVCPSDASGMFTSCTNLITIPLLDTSNVTNMQGMFASCTNLTTIPLLDTSSVINMNSMFTDCTNLTAIPSLNTSSATAMASMFRSCTNLTTIPLLDTANVTNMFNMFAFSPKITTIPLLNTSKVTNMEGMFRNCTSLTDESLNNILAMCTNAVKITSSSYKTLKYIGLTSEQATRCTTLSNYSAFTSAGWTTGY